MKKNITENPSLLREEYIDSLKELIKSQELLIDIYKQQNAELKEMNAELIKFYQPVKDDCK